MLSCGIDTNILLRFYNPYSPLQAQVVKALSSLRVRDIRLFCTFQNLAEFRNVSTRSVEQNGLRWSAEEAESALTKIDGSFE